MSENEPSRQDNPTPRPGEIREKDGVKYIYADTGLTIREYFSHSTSEKGLGPGWDFRWPVLKKYGVDEPSKLPDEPFCEWIPLDELSEKSE